MYSDRERIAHVVRRLGIGANPWLAVGYNSVDEAKAGLLAPPATPADLPQLPVPKTWNEVDYEVIVKRLIPWWMDVIVAGKQPLTERLTWFWHDHFAINGNKVGNTYAAYEHHRLVRRHATGSFEELLRAVARDAAMLWYLDGAQNAYGTPNENFGREVMELHTLGPGNYTQRDVSEIARAFTGWVVNEPDGEAGALPFPNVAAWTGVLDPERHDPAMKVVLGTTGLIDMDAAIDLLLDHPATGPHVAAKLYRELVGVAADDNTAQRLGALFRRDYAVIPLVEAIVAEPAFTSDEAIRAKVRTPLEKAATVLQGLPRVADAPPETVSWMLDKLAYLPLHAPNPAGFPFGTGLLDPARLLGGFELLNLARNLDEDGAPAIDVPLALGLFDLSDDTRATLERFPRTGMKLGLAFGCPEFLAV
jgi:uncharacterized protein (DUF1800 family)